MTPLKAFSQFQAYLIYPFHHNLPARKSKKHFGTILKMWEPWLNRFPDEKEGAKAIENSYFFLPYIREILFPQVIHWELMNREKDPEKRLTQQQRMLASFLDQKNLVRLTLKSELLESFRLPKLMFSMGDEKFETTFRVDWVDAFLFPQQAGFLCLKITVPDPPVAIETCNNLLYYLRLIHPPSLDWTLAEWLVEQDAQPLRFQTRDLVDYLMQVFTTGQGNLFLRPAEFMNHLQGSQEFERYSESYTGQVYGEVFQILTYGCLDETNRTMEKDESETSGDALPEILKDPYNYILYEMSTITLLSDTLYLPNADYVENLFKEHRIAIFENWEAMALQNNVMFLGKIRDRFTKVALPENIEFDYLMEYLLVCFQKFRLSMMLGELIRKEERIEKNLKELRRLQEDFMNFQNRFWFNEISRKPIGMEIFSKFQAGLKVLPLYDELKEEVANLHSHFERKAERGVSTLLHIITFIGLPATLLMEAFSSVIFPNPSIKLLILSSLGIYSGVAVIILIWKFIQKL